MTVLCPVEIERAIETAEEFGPRIYAEAVRRWVFPAFLGP